MTRNEIKDQIIESNKKGEFSMIHQKELQISNSCYRHMLRELKLKWICKRYRKYELNHDYFKSIDSAEKAYWIGFIYADGHVSDDGFLMVQLQMKDKEILEKFCKDIEYNGPIKVRQIKNKFYCSLRIWSKSFQLDLNQIGLHRHKTMLAEIPKISKDLFFHFLRGFIDGDGTIFTKQTDKKFISSVHILCHEKIVNYIIDNIKIVIPSFTGSVYNHWRTSYIRTISVNGNIKTFTFLDFLYKDATRFLARKHIKYLEIKAYHDSKTDSAVSMSTSP